MKNNEEKLDIIWSQDITQPWIRVAIDGTTVKVVEVAKTIGGPSPSASYVALQFGDDSYVINAASSSCDAYDLLARGEVMPGYYKTRVIQLQPGAGSLAVKLVNSGSSEIRYKRVG